MLLLVSFIIIFFYNNYCCYHYILILLLSLIIINNNDDVVGLLRVVDVIALHRPSKRTLWTCTRLLRSLRPGVDRQALNINIVNYGFGSQNTGQFAAV